MSLTKITVMFLGLIICAVGLLPILKMTVLQQQLAFLPSNPLVYYILTVLFGLAVIFYSVKHLDQVY